MYVFKPTTCVESMDLIISEHMVLSKVGLGWTCVFTDVPFFYYLVVMTIWVDLNGQYPEKIKRKKKDVIESLLISSALLDC